MEAINTVEDLKNGYLVELRNGTKGIVQKIQISNWQSFRDIVMFDRGRNPSYTGHDSWDYMSIWDKKTFKSTLLNHEGSPNKPTPYWDIVKVYGYMTHLDPTIGRPNMTDIFDTSMRSLLWEED